MKSRLVEGGEQPCQEPHLVSQSDEEYFAQLVPRMSWVREELLQSYNWHVTSNIFWYLKVLV